HHSPPHTYPLSLHDALPISGHQVWRRISKADRIPIYTVWAICVLSFLLEIPTLFWGYTGYVVSTSVAVIGLYIAFVLPIILRLRSEEHTSELQSPYDLVCRL